VVVVAVVVVVDMVVVDVDHNADTGRTRAALDNNATVSDTTDVQ
jgi:hypothetical protein